MWIITWIVKTNLSNELVPIAGQEIDDKELANAYFKEVADMLSSPGEYVSLYRRKRLYYQISK